MQVPVQNGVVLPQTVFVPNPAGRAAKKILQIVFLYPRAVKMV